MSPQEIAQAVAETLGEENIKSATHCMTRLRLRLKVPEEIGRAHV